MFEFFSEQVKDKLPNPLHRLQHAIQYELNDEDNTDFRCVDCFETFKDPIEYFSHLQEEHYVHAQQNTIKDISGKFES